MNRLTPLPRFEYLDSGSNWQKHEMRIGDFRISFRCTQIERTPNCILYLATSYLIHLNGGEEKREVIYNQTGTMFFSDCNHKPDDFVPIADNEWALKAKAKALEAAREYIHSRFIEDEKADAIDCLDLLLNRHFQEPYMAADISDLIVYNEDNKVHYLTVVGTGTAFNVQHYIIWGHPEDFMRRLLGEHFKIEHFWVSETIKSGREPYVYRKTMDIIGKYEGVSNKHKFSVTVQSVKLKYVGKCFSEK